MLYSWRNRDAMLVNGLAEWVGCDEVFKEWKAITPL